MFRIAIVAALIAVLFIPSQDFISAQSAQPAEVRELTGESLASIQVDEITEPFDLYDPGYPPTIGYHFVLLSLTVENQGSQPWLFNPASLYLRDEQGYLFDTTTIYRDENLALPDLEYQDVPAATSIEGSVGFEVLNGSWLTGLFFSPDSEQLVQIAEFSGQETVELGSDIQIVGNEGRIIGAISILSYEEPFEEFLDDYGPEQGHHFVGLEALVGNAGPRSLHIDPNEIYLQDSDGFLHGPETIYRIEGGTPGLEYQDLEPDSSVTGWIGYSIPDGRSIERVIYQPTSDRLLILGDIPDELRGPDSSEPVDSTPESTTPQDDSTPDTTTPQVDCVATSAWIDFFEGEAFAAPPVIISFNEARESDHPDVADYARNTAALFQVVAEDLRTSIPPNSLRDLSNRLADAYETYSSALQNFADSVESGDEPAIDESGQVIDDAEEAVMAIFDEIDSLVSSCEA